MERGNRLGERGEGEGVGRGVGVLNMSPTLPASFEPAGAKLNGPRAQGTAAQLAAVFTPDEVNAKDAGQSSGHMTKQECQLLIQTERGGALSGTCSLGVCVRERVRVCVRERERKRVRERERERLSD